MDQLVLIVYDSYQTAIKWLTCPKTNLEKDLELHTKIHTVVAKYLAKKSTTRTKRHR